MNNAPKRHRVWRRQAKKFQRKRKRKLAAQNRDANVDPVELEYDQNQMIGTIERQNEIENELWLRYDRHVMRRWAENQRKIAETQRLKDEEKARIAEEFEKEQQRLADIESIARRAVENQQMLESILIGRIMDYINADGPLPSELLEHQELNPLKPPCPFYDKIGTCRFGLRCARNHKRPRISCILLISEFFTNIRLNNTGKASEYGDDIGIEFDEDELYHDFEEFFDDVVPEFEKFGTISQFRVCQNVVKHLRGNVYIEYKNQRDAMRAYQNMQGRFYGGRNINIEFCNIDWNAALCGLSSYPFRRNCARGLNCNYLHVFKNPQDKFSLQQIVELKQSIQRNRVASAINESIRKASDTESHQFGDSKQKDRNWRWSESPPAEVSSHFEERKDHKEHNKRRRSRSRRRSRDSKRRKRSRSKTGDRKSKKKRHKERNRSRSPSKLRDHRNKKRRK